jgi:hypothetical protein
LDVVLLGVCPYPFEGGFAQGGQALAQAQRVLDALGHGTYRDKYLGVKIPPTNLRDYHLKQAKGFAGQLADTLFPHGSGEGDIMSDTQFDVVMAAYLIPDLANK